MSNAREDALERLWTSAANRATRLADELAASEAARRKAEAELAEFTPLMTCGHPRAALDVAMGVCTVCELVQRADKAERERNELRRELAAVNQVLQRHQPAGSPPSTGDAEVLADWVLTVLRQERDEFAAALNYHFTRCQFGPDTEPWPHAKAILSEHDATKDAEIAQLRQQNTELAAAWKASVPCGKLPAPWEDNLAAVLAKHDARLICEVQRLRKLCGETVRGNDLLQDL